MDGQNRQGLGIALHSKLLLFEAAGKRGSLFVHPFQGAPHAGTLLRDRLVQQLPQVKQIGQPALAVGQAQEVLCNAVLGQHPPEKREKADFLPDGVVADKPLQDCLPPRRRFPQSQLLPGPPQKPRGQSGFQSRRIVGLRHRAQDIRQFIGFRSTEYIPGIVNDRRNPSRCHAGLDLPGLTVGAHQNGNVAGGPTRVHLRIFRWRLQEPPHFSGDCRQDLRGGLRFG